MGLKEEERKKLVDEIVEIRENSAVLQVELFERGIEGLREVVAEQAGETIKTKILEYLEE